MTKSAEIRHFAAEGFAVADVAKKVGVSYQHAYNVLKQGKSTPRSAPTGAVTLKPSLSADTLLNAGFHYAASWRLDQSGSLNVSTALPKDVGVYAFIQHGVTMYIGVATMGLAKRLYFYAKPGVSQRTSFCINEIIRSELSGGAAVDILIAQPANTLWNGLPVRGTAGLELGLIKAYALPWNMRSAN